MATAECSSRPPPCHPETNRGNLNTQTNTGALNSGQQGPGPHATIPDLGPSTHPQPHIPPQPRPFFYMHAAPPPPLLHYQWPMPFPYNPFAGFPGMGYGVVIPPYPPNPYMEAPGYILPHPHIQPVDYRRLLHPTVPTANAPYQSQNPNRRFRPQYNVSVARETVNTEVQTEPALTRTISGYGERSPVSSSESGHGTHSTSPSSSSSSTGKGGHTEVENYTVPSSNAKQDFFVSRSDPGKGTAKDGFKASSAAPEKILSRIRTPLEPQKKYKGSIGQENGASSTQGGVGHCEMWSVCSTDSMVPVCSSSDREDDVVSKERRVSFPDILMSWGVSTPPVAMLKMADKMLAQTKDQPPHSEDTEAEHEKTANLNLTEHKSSQVVVNGNDTEDNDAEENFTSKESEILHKILKLPFTLQEVLSASRKENKSVGLVGSIRTSKEWVVNHESQDSLNESQKVPDAGHEQENGSESIVLETSSEIVPHQMSFSYVQIKRKMNESVWSVESLAPYIPSQEWLIQNGVSEPDVIIEEIAENGENDDLSTQNDSITENPKLERRHSRRFSLSSDSLPVYVSSAGWLGDQCKVYCHKRFPLTSQQNIDVFSTTVEKRAPEKRPEMQCKIHSSKMEGQLDQGLSTESSVRDSLESPPLLQIVMGSSTEKDVDKDGSSEPGAEQSPNQKSLNVIEEQELSPCSPELEEIPLSKPLAGGKSPSKGQLSLHDNEVKMKQEAAVHGHEEPSQPRIVHLGVKMADQKLSPSKGHLVDCGVQCSEIQEVICPCKEIKNKTGINRKSPHKHSDWKKANKAKGAEEASENGHMHKNQKKHGQWKNRLQDRQQTQNNPSNKLFVQYNSQEESYSGYYGKPGKTKGGNGRNPRY